MIFPDVRDDANVGIFYLPGPESKHGVGNSIIISSVRDLKGWKWNRKPIYVIIRIRHPNLDAYEGKMILLREEMTIYPKLTCGVIE
jgi:hypothetical protein